MRVLCHAQHFKGIGHFIRMHAIARGMSEPREVYAVDGGRPVPRHSGPIDAQVVEEIPDMLFGVRGGRFTSSVFADPSDPPPPDLGALAERCRDIASRLPCIECRMGLGAFDGAAAADDLIAAILRS